MFRDLYAAELEYLYGLAESVGREHSRIAPMLGRDADPSVTRIAQTVAFLSARIRQRLDDDLPELIHPLVEGLCPWLLRPLPSSTIVELSPEPAMQEPIRAPAGSSFASRPVDGGSCQFQSLVDVDVRPWELVEVGIANERRELRLRLALLSGAARARLEGALRLFLAMPGALDVRSALLRGTEIITASASEGAGSSVVLAEGRGALRQVPVRPPGPNRIADAAFLLRAYYASAEQYAFVEVPNLERLSALGDKARSFDLTLRLRTPLPPNVRIDARSVRLHCVPSANLRRLPTKTMPIHRGRCTLDVGDAEPHSIARVTLIAEDLTTRVAHPYSQLIAAPVGDDGRLPVLYRVVRTGSVVGPRLDTSLVLVDPEGTSLGFDPVSADIDLTVTDGERAARLGLGDVCIPNRGSPALVSFRNVTPITRSAAPMLEGDRLWRWFQLFKATFAQACDRDLLAEALALPNIAACANWPGAKPGPDRLEGLASVRSTRVTLAVTDELRLGAHIDVGVKQESFAGPGDLDLFGQCAARFIGATLRPGDWATMTLRDESGQVLFDYEAEDVCGRDLET